MSTYVIGDIQGCYDELWQLLDQLDFNSDNDRVIFAGDLVNRGPKSLEVLRFVKNLGKAADAVLGNHDLHLLAIKHGNLSHAKGTSLDAILSAPDRIDLLDWLQHRPMMIYLEDLQTSVIHAGLPPQWTLKEALTHAAELEQTIQSDKADRFFKKMYGNEPLKWDDELQGIKRLRFITNCFSRLRYCTAKGKLGLEEKGTPGSQNKSLMPWFDVPGRKTADDRILFGHWSTLGLVDRHTACCLDTGCLWGGFLTAMRVEDSKVFQLDCKGELKPGK